MTSTKNSNGFRWEVVCFVNNCSIHCSEGMEKLGLSDAVYNMCNWLADGVEFPDDMTPEELMTVWNYHVDSMNRYQDGLEPNDDDEI